MTYEKLENKINNDLTWRKREFSELGFLLQNNELSVYQRDILLKASIALLYSHWEGHIKYSAIKYIEYVNEQNIPVGDLTENFKQIFLPAHFSNQTLTIQNIRSQKLLHDFFQNHTLLFKVNSKKTISTKSNLDSDITTEILMQLGFDTNLFDSYKTFIDEQLLAARNAISHGDKAAMYKHNLENVYTQIKENLLNMIQEFDDYVLDSVQNERYLKINKLE
ncbi:MAE_28990/MAE_18760 family HEPN-like nuclease [Mannheimia pernigra]|uniref:MAE_28990/MAE_18760 family HEPN-like nuclease n=1 Tax=Mannheimia pernigra TaxID=111844 RepID=UPI0013163095|nr:MAE_28990/MAE_18760 family HEPN-like nuclease [Mannheimia pernigra]QHB18253.1 hypothetical protein GM695_09575 [Mannheimia pernigra]